METARDDHGSARLRRRARNSRELTRLFARREDLRGVSTIADVVADSVRWTV